MDAPAYWLDANNRMAGSAITVSSIARIKMPIEKPRNTWL